MKTLFNFLFAYGHLGWKGRLSRRDHLYHQGRNALAVVLFALPMAAFFFATMYSMLVGGENQKLVFFSSIAAMVLLGGVLLYLAFNAIRLTVLRLHDFNRSGWWILALVALGVIDVVLDELLVHFSSFASLQNLAYLGLLILPGQAVANRFGNPDDLSTAGKPRIIRAVPLVMFFGAWVLAMAAAFGQQAQLKELQKQIAQTEQTIEDSERKMQEALNALENDAEFKNLIQQIGEANAVEMDSVTESTPEATSPTDIQ